MCHQCKLKNRDCLYNLTSAVYLEACYMHEVKHHGCPFTREEFVEYFIHLGIHRMFMERSVSGLVKEITGGEVVHVPPKHTLN
jgi:hypothetical protein